MPKILRLLKSEYGMVYCIHTKKKFSILEHFWRFFSCILFTFHFANSIFNKRNSEICAVNYCMYLMYLTKKKLELFSCLYRFDSGQQAQSPHKATLEQQCIITKAAEGAPLWVVCATDEPSQKINMYAFPRIMCRFFVFSSLIGIRHLKKWLFISKFEIDFLFNRALADPAKGYLDGFFFLMLSEGSQPNRNDSCTFGWESFDNIRKTFNKFYHTAIRTKFCCVSLQYWQ